MKPLGIGIVGTGNIAGRYARDILTHPGIHLVAASDLDPVRASAFAAAHGCRAHASLDGLLADEAVDVVVNLTVHHAHYEVTRRALGAGRHVYSEKPLALRSWGWNLRPDRVAIDGTPFRIGSPDLILAAVELEGGAVLRLTASFYVGRPVKQRGALEFHGDAGSLALGSFQDFDATVEAGPYDGSYEAVPYVRPPFAGIAWARGLADMAAAIAEGRPHRASAEQAAHVVDILEAAAASITAEGRPIEVTSTFVAPPLMPWASIREDVRPAP